MASRAVSDRTTTTVSPEVRPQVHDRVAVDDSREHEADHLVDRVLRMPDPSSALHPPSRRPDGSTAPTHPGMGLPGELVSLPAAVKAFTRTRFTKDVSDAQVHAGPRSGALARRFHAHALTYGAHIYMDPARYRPDTAAGQRLLAHEFAHVLQQRGQQPRIQRLIRTPYPWRGVIIPAAGANVRSSPDASDPSNILDALPQGHPVKVLSATGNWLRIETQRGPSTLSGFVHHRLVDDAASRSLEASVGTTMVWKPSGPGSGTDFETWASAAAETPFPAVTASTVMNCWEAVLLAAYRAGAIDWKWIHNLYTAVPVGNWVAAMSRGPTRTYAIPGPNKHMPQRGDIVFFDGLAHVALATGKGSEVYTFWPPPNTPFTPGGTTDKVKVFPIEDLVSWWTANLGSTPVVTFAAPAW